MVKLIDEKLGQRIANVKGISTEEFNSNYCHQVSNDRFLFRNDKGLWYGNGLEIAKLNNKDRS